MTPAARCRALALAIGALILGPFAAPAAAQDPLCAPPPPRLALTISTRAPVRRPVAARRPARKPLAAKPVVAALPVKAAPAKAAAKTRRPVVARRPAKRPASVVPIPTAAMAAPVRNACRSAGSLVATVMHADGASSGQVALIDELPALLPDTIVQDDSTGVPLLWWLGAAGAVVAGAGITDEGGGGTGAVVPPGTVAVTPPGSAWGEGDPHGAPSGSTGGGSGVPPTNGGPGTDPGSGGGSPPPTFPPPTIVGSTPPFGFPPGGPPGSPPGGPPPGWNPPPQPPGGGPPPTWDQPPTVTTASVVPEPAPLGLLLVGSAVLSLVLWGMSRRS